MRKPKGLRLSCVFLWVFSFFAPMGAHAQGLAPPASLDPQPLGTEGATTTFRYWQSPSETNTYIVQPIGNTGFTFQVSESYLGLVVNSPPIDDKMRLSVLIQYPFYMDQLYQNRTTTSYPDAGTPASTPFQPFSDGYLSIAQDSMALPYVRVRINKPGEAALEFSINRAVVDRLIEEGTVTGTNLAEALRKYSYRLPDEARSNFRNLNSAQIMSLAAQSVPSVSGQEFVRARRWYGEKLTNSVTAPADAQPPPVPLRQATEPETKNEPSVRIRSATAASAEKPRADFDEVTPPAEDDGFDFQFVIRLTTALLAGACLTWFIRKMRAG